ADELEGAPVALIDDLLARRFFANGSALGSPLLIGDDTLTIVGVVDQARHYSVQADDRYQVYLPLALNATASLRYVVAGAGDPTRLVPDLRRILDDIDPTVPLTDAGTLQGLIEQSLGRERLSLTLLSVFAAAALLLAVLGIYGVVANQVTQRTHEMGVRMALGADRSGVLRLVLGQGARLTVWGTVLGLLAAVAASRVLVGVVAGVDPRDPVVYAGVALTLAAVTLLAAWVPARRAARIDPTEALRAE
ncbi:MAG: ABC transporter permease, partial [Gemmatimonadetes bacterium]|nr:ABC transporter permease [Gemmatimonadota bacterium]